MQDHKEEIVTRAYSYTVPDTDHLFVEADGESDVHVNLPEHDEHTFVNPFGIEDLLIFDRQSLGRVLAMTHLAPEHLAWALHQASEALLQHVFSCLPVGERSTFWRAFSHPGSANEIALAHHLLLDKLFWELTYWKTPELYEELVAGEHLHPGIFQQLESLLQNKVVLDAGAGCGRASFAALEHGASLIYAVEPSPGLRRLFAQKLAAAPVTNPIVLRAGDFTHVPLPDQSVDVALTCSAFTAEPEQGGEPALAELRRVTRIGGYIVLIWPRPIDLPWLAARGFRYVALPQAQEMSLTFPSWQSAWHCVQRFYARNRNVQCYLRHARQPRLPFSVLGFNAPCDYCWLQVT